MNELKPVKPSKSPGTPIRMGGLGSVGSLMGLTIIAIAIGILIAEILK